MASSAYPKVTGLGTTPCETSSCSGEAVGHSGRRASPVVLAGFAMLYGWLVIFALPIEYVTAALTDDAFYYLCIARNIISGNGCTFDGIAPTNGFHPLWMLCILPIVAFADELETPARIVLALNGLMCILTIALIHRFVNRHVAPGLGLVALSICLLPNMLMAMANGLETGLLLLVLVLVLWACYRGRLFDPRSAYPSAFALGVLIGLTCLVRLDSVFLLPSFLLLVLASGLSCGVSVWRCVAYGVLATAGFGVAVAPYLAWNLLAFGDPMPISGAVKSTFPAIRRDLTVEADMAFGGVLLAGILLLLVVDAAGARRAGVRVASRLCTPVSAVALACCFHFAYAFLFMSWGVYWWHFTLYGFALVLVGSRAVGALVAFRSDLRRVLVPLMVVLTAAAAAAFKLYEIPIKMRSHAGWLAAAEWARTATPPDAVFALKDAGLFGYFSQRRVVNLDGKANGRSYRDHLRQGLVEGYLRKVNTRYVADVHAHYHQGIYRICIHRAGQDPVILMMAEGREVFRSKPIPSTSDRLRTSPESWFAIWAYAPNVTETTGE